MKKVSIKILILFIILSDFFVSCKVTVNPKPDKEKELYEAAKKMPLTLLAEEDGIIKLRRTDLVTNFKYTINGGEPVPVYSRNLVNIDVVEGDEVRFYGEGTHNDLDNYFDINCSKACSVYGNVMSLLTAEYQTATVITNDYAFRRLFNGNYNLKNHKEKKLVLPATKLADYCYFSMFINCRALTEAPKLPATTLANHCYDYMFGGCVSLTKAPELPAKSLAVYCYAYMFNGCTSLTEAPKLPAKNLTVGCYTNMFSRCSSLTEAPELPAITLAQFCYECMFSACTSLLEAPELPATTLAINCYASMFSGCTLLTKTPELNAPILVNSCYHQMFSGCTNLNYVKCLATDVSASNCVGYWLSGVPSKGIIITPSTTQWPEGDSGIPSGWTRVNAQ